MLSFEGFDGTVILTEDLVTYQFREADIPKEMALQLQTATGLILGMREI